MFMRIYGWTVSFAAGFFGSEVYAHDPHKVIEGCVISLCGGIGGFIGISLVRLVRSAQPQEPK